ncbi:MAG TPA: diguanylate cyclase [Verrucomicrobiae bacterium]|nr:diguanylate cyclase [Verrucomicrobiae bacterium]
MNDSTPVAGAKPKILVVDDQSANLLAAGKILSRLPVEVFTARSGSEALGLLLRHEFAVILLDVRMPGMDGYETAGLIRSHTEKNPVPIIFVTAEASEQRSVFQGYESGAVDYLLKPIDELQLLSKLRVFLDLYEHGRRLAQTTAELAHSNQRLQRLLHAVGDGIIGIEADGRISFINPAACRFLQAAPTQLLNQPVLDLMTPDEGEDPFERARASGVYRRNEAAFKTARGEPLAVEYVLSSVEGASESRPSRTTFVLVFQDISDRLAAEKILRRLAEVDHLTGLANRLLFEQKLGAMLARPDGDNRPFALLMLDLDGFKAVNDRHGHAVGDFLLKAVAQRLQAQLRDTDLPARLGGDEFALLLGGTREVDDALRIGGEIARRLGEPYDCGGQELRVGASVGVALHPLHGHTVEALEQAADEAMYAAKRQDGGAAMLAKAPVA